MSRFKHIVMNNGWHYILDEKKNYQGDAASYQNIAGYKDQDGSKYIAVTEYFNGNLLVPGVVYQIRPAVQV